MNGTSELEPTPAAEALLKEYSELLRTRVLARARDIAAQQSPGDTGTTDGQSDTKRSIEGMHMALAIQNFEAGQPPPLVPPLPQPGSARFSKRFLV
jgi:hypothetical protein